MKTLYAGLFLLTFVALLSWVDLPGHLGQKKKPKFTIGKETTYATSPVDEDGFIDYFAALNERLGRGATAANNAMVLLCQAMGPKPEGADLPEDFYQMLAAHPPAAQGDYFIQRDRFFRDQLKIDISQQHERLEEERVRVRKAPWAADQHPQIAAWLKVNDKPLALVVQASRRPRYYHPLTTRDKRVGLIGSLLAYVQSLRGAADALTARAMLRTTERRLDEAWQDLLACHRLARLLMGGGTLIESLVGMAIDNQAANADLAYLERISGDPKRLRACLRDLQQLPPPKGIADIVDVSERMMFLDIAMKVSQEGPDYLEKLSGGGKPPEGASVANFFGNLLIRNLDWDIILRMGNQWYDRMAAAMRLPDRAAREKEFSQIIDEVKAMRDRTGGLKELRSNPSAETIAKTMGEMLIALLTPALERVQTAADKNEQERRNLQVAFALAAYRAERGRYPQKLGELAPGYLAVVPNDLFSGAPLIYRPAGGGYLLYSVGPNGQDDQGRTKDSGPDADDLTVRMPLGSGN